MELRRVEVAVPAGRAEEVHDLDAAEPAIDVRSLALGADDATRLVSILLPADAVEPLTDALAERIETADGFRIWVSRVEATMPRASRGRTPGRTGQAGSAARNSTPTSAKRPVPAPPSRSPSPSRPSSRR